MLEKIKDLVEKLNLEFPEWPKVIQENMDQSEKWGEKLKNIFLELAFTIKNICIEEEKDVSTVLENIFKEEKTATVIEKYVNNLMIYYNLLQPIRKLSYEEPETTKNIMGDIFENYILRLDYQIYNRYKYFNKDSEDGVKKIFSAIDRLTDYYVEHLLVKKEVQNDFKAETGISLEICEYYANLYEENFKELKQNLMLHKLNDLEYILNSLQKL